jgi:branched-subunit amino acid ABC-type transport system permease component
VNTSLLLTQLLNGLQLGVMLFLMSAGLTLVLGIMNLVNLAHGAFFMMGAYLAAQVQIWTGSFVLAILIAVPATWFLGLIVDYLCLRPLYDRNHLDQVLSTFGLVLFFNEFVRFVWGAPAVFIDYPTALAGTVEIVPGAPYPIYRLVILGIGIVVALLLYFVIAHTRIGMVVRAGASNRVMTASMGVNIGLLSTLVFAAGAALAGLAGVISAPLLSVQSGLGDPVLILTLVVIVIGGIGSIRGAIGASIIVGLVDSVGRIYLPHLFALVVPPVMANAMGPALASMLIYLLMAAILALKPQGLWPARSK